MTTTITELEREELILLESKNRTYKSILETYDDLNSFSAIIIRNKIDANNERINKLNLR